MIVDADYLKSLHRSNVNLKWDTIERFTKKGVRFTNGEETPLDVLIFATGFSVVGIQWQLNLVLRLTSIKRDT